MFLLMIISPQLISESKPTPRTKYGKEQFGDDMDSNPTRDMISHDGGPCMLRPGTRQLLSIPDGVAM